MEIVIFGSAFGYDAAGVASGVRPLGYDHEFRFLGELAQFQDALTKYMSGGAMYSIPRYSDWCNTIGWFSPTIKINGRSGRDIARAVGTAWCSFGHFNRRAVPTLCQNLTVMASAVGELADSKFIYGFTTAPKNMLLPFPFVRLSTSPQVDNRVPGVAVRPNGYSNFDFIVYAMWYFQDRVNKDYSELWPEDATLQAKVARAKNPRATAHVFDFWK